MSSGDVGFIALAANPIGGLLVAIPFAIVKLHYPAWLAIAAGVPLAYLQVIAVDLTWSSLIRLTWWRRLVETTRSPRAERLVASNGAFWITFLASPFLGPWLVMALMRYAHVPQRRVALPIALALVCTAAVLVAISVYVPSWVAPKA
jgi:hypothetical protein